WSSRGWESRPEPRSRACATTSISTATTSSGKIRGLVSSSSTASNFHPNRPALASEKKDLVLAEGHSGDEHYGKTLRGIVHYSPHPVVAILDSARAGESYRDIPIVRTVDEALLFAPTTAVVGVATQGGRFPPAWRELLKDSIRAGLDVESGLHEFISEDEELSALAERHGV